MTSPWAWVCQEASLELALIGSLLYFYRERERERPQLPPENQPAHVGEDRAMKKHWRQPLPNPVRSAVLWTWPLKSVSMAGRRL